MARFVLLRNFADIQAAQRELSLQRLDLEDVMRIGVEWARSLTGTESAAIALVEGEDIVCRAEDSPQPSLLGERSPLERSLSGEALRTGRTILCHDLQRESRADPEIVRRSRIRSAILVPIAFGGEAMGVLMVGSSGVGALSERQVAVLELFTPIVSAAISDARRRAAEAARDVALKRVRLLQRVAVAANESRSVEEALTRALREVCEERGWPMGHVWLPGNDGALEPSGIWYVKNPGLFESFRRATGETRLAPGQGLVGTAWSTGRPHWIMDVRSDPTFVPRGEADPSVRTALAFPVRIGEEVVAVLEFFSDEAEEPSLGLLEAMAAVGVQLGRVFERQRS